MNYLSVCSGIEAATVAWHHMGWKPVTFSEIEKFPSAVLAHHYPDVPNLGDMTKFHEWPNLDINLLVGGTPCQAFSVAGLRQGLSDPRGNLTLTFLGVADRYRPEWVVWENVPGVLSDRTNAFGQFLAGLAELGYGCAYRMLDAQYFGVAQRRKRVFVVGCLGGWERAAAVLFEPESLLGNPPPSREARKRIAPCLAARTKGGGGLGTDFDLDGGCSRNCGNKFGVNDYPRNPTCPKCRCMTVDDLLQGDSFPEGTELAFAEPGSPNNPGPDEPICFSSKDHRADAGSIAPTLRAGGHSGSHANAGVPPAIAFAHQADGTQTTLGYNPESATSPCLNKSQTMAVAIGLQDDTTPKFTHERIGALRADAGGEGACVQHRMSVRRLTPTECERLQGFTTMIDRVVFDLCLDRQNNSVRVEIKCLRSPSSALRAEGNASSENASSAETTLWNDLESHASAAHAHVRLLHEPRLHAIHSAGRLMWPVNGVEKFAMSLRPTPLEDFAAALVAVQQEADLLAGRGKAASPQNMTSFILPANGNWFASVFGKENEESASVAASSLREAITFIISSLGQKTNTSRLIQPTWLCSALSVIASCIPSETPLVNSVKLIVDVERDYTNIPWRNKPTSPDGPRYKALGNSMAVPCMRWIGERIKMVSEQPEGMCLD